MAKDAAKDLAEAWALLEQWSALCEWHSYSIAASSRIQSLSGHSKPQQFTASLHTGTIAVDDFHAVAAMPGQAIRMAVEAAKAAGEWEAHG